MENTTNSDEIWIVCHEFNQFVKINHGSHLFILPIWLEKTSSGTYVIKYRVEKEYAGQQERNPWFAMSGSLVKHDNYANESIDTKKSPFSETYVSISIRNHLTEISRKSVGTEGET